MRRPRLVLHAGDCKAGSTAIQSVLQGQTYRVDGRMIWGEAPLLYAEGGRRQMLNHHRLSNGLVSKSARAAGAEAWARLGAEVRGTDADVVALSSERFEFVPPEAVRAALETHVPEAMGDLTVVIYVRPHAERLLSGYAQNVKQGLFTGDLDGFVAWMAEAGRLAYADRLGRWRDVFGPALIVRPMMRSELEGGCVVRDFLALCLPGRRVDVARIPAPNVALDALTLTMLARLNGKLTHLSPALHPERATLLQHFAARLETSGAGMRGPKVRLTRSTAARLPALYGEDAARCDAEIFGRPLFAPALDAAVAMAMSDAAAPPSEIGWEDAAERMAELSLAWLEVLRRAEADAPRRGFGRAPGAQRAPLAQGQLGVGLRT